MKHGTVFQRHSKKCPRGDAGEWLPHRCRGSWSYVIDALPSSAAKRKQIARGGFPTRAAAVGALREVTDLMRTDIGHHAMTVAEYLDVWLAGKLSLKPSTRSHYADAIRLYLKPNIGRLQLLELRPHHLDKLYVTIATGARGKPLSAASIRRVHGCVRSALNSAVKRRLMPYNPAVHVELPSELPKRAQPWTPEQCRQFLEAAAEDRLAALYHLMLVTGLRRGEAVGLRWSDVDLDRAFLRVVQQITEVRGKPTIGTPKTRRGSRVLPLDPVTVSSLGEHRDRQLKERADWGQAWEDTGLVFTRDDGRVLRPEYVTRHFQSLTRAAGLPVIRLHDLRHTNATLALEAGIDVKVVSERLGHATTAITYDLYTHVAPRVGLDAAARIAEVLHGPARSVET